MSNPVEQQKLELRANLRYSIGDGAAFGAMVGLGETYFPAFVLAVGLGELMAGLIGSVPLLIGGLLQLVSPWMIVRLGSHKRWVVICAAVQTSMFIPLILAGYAGRISSLAVLAIASVYWGASLATGPAWNTWIGTLVPVPVRPRFFAYRTRISQACVFGGFLCSGFALQQTSGSPQQLMIMFAGLFLAAGIFRAISTVMLAYQTEPIPIPGDLRPPSLWKLWSDLKNGPGGPLLVFLVAIQAAVQFSGPYFTPFMLNYLHHSYAEYVTLIAVAFLARIFTLPLWGKIAQRVGTMKLFYIGAFGITPISGLWVISQDFYWLFAAQILSGAVWAAYELAFLLLFFESIPAEERTGMLTIYNLINTTAWVIGSLLGAGLLLYLETSYSAYLTLFALSVVMRATALLLLFRIPNVDVEADEIGLRTIAVRPTGGNLDAPVLPSMPDQIPDEFQGRGDLAERTQEQSAPVE